MGQSDDRGRPSAKQHDCRELARRTHDADGVDCRRVRHEPNRGEPVQRLLLRRLDRHGGRTEESQWDISVSTQVQDQCDGQGDLDPRCGCLRRGLPVGCDGLRAWTRSGERHGEMG